MCVILSILAMLILPACGTSRKIPEYTGSHLLPPLEVPPDLDVPAYNEQTKIPDFPAAAEGTTGVDMSGTMAAGTRSIEEPPVFLEEDNSAN